MTINQFVEKTGLDGDYLNEWSSKAMISEYKGIKGLTKSIQNKPIKTYQIRYLGSEEHRITDKNKTAILNIEILTKDINKKAANNKLTLEEFATAADEVATIVYGYERTLYH